MADIDNTQDVIDVRDIIERIEELREELHARQADDDTDELDSDDASELRTLESLMSNLAGNGGDEQWEGVWYPVTLIRDSYFTDYARELCEEIGDLPNGMPSYIVVDWEATAANIRQDYSSVEYDDVTYWYR